MNDFLKILAQTSEYPSVYSYIYAHIYISPGTLGRLWLLQDMESLSNFIHHCRGAAYAIYHCTKVQYECGCFPLKIRLFLPER